MHAEKSISAESTPRCAMIIKRLADLSDRLQYEAAANKDMVVVLGGNSKDTGELVQDIEHPRNCTLDDIEFYIMQLHKTTDRLASSNLLLKRIVPC